MMPSVDAFAGCLIGQCLGDALGFVVEGETPEACQAYVNGCLRAGGAGARGRPPYPFGQYSDDSQLARELLESYVVHGAFNPEDYARRIAAIFLGGRIVGGGQSTGAAAMRLARGVPWHAAGTPAPSAGNGSAMRAGLVGLICADDADGMVATARLQGRITHADPRCEAGAVAIAGAVFLGFDGQPIHVLAFIDRLAQWTEPLSPVFTGELRRLPVWLDMPPDRAGPEVAKAGVERASLDRGAGVSPFVTSSVLWSLYSFLRTPDDYWETICTAIAVGGDVDTTAAMAGAISGAHLGLAAVPLRLAQQLEDRGTWRYEALVGLAREAHAHKTESGG